MVQKSEQATGCRSSVCRLGSPVDAAVESHRRTQHQAAIPGTHTERTAKAVGLTRGSLVEERALRGVDFSARREKLSLYCMVYSWSFLFNVGIETHSFAIRWVYVHSYLESLLLAQLTLPRDV